jgi:hypothetical protein
MIIKDKYINDLNDFHDLIKEDYDEETADFLVELVGERIVQETNRLKEYIEIYSKGFEQALFHKEFHERVSGNIFDHLDSEDIIKAEVLNYRIYRDYDHPNWYARTESGVDILDEAS